MTALAAACHNEVPMIMMWQPDPVRQLRANYTIEDVLNLPEDAPRVELVDGVMVVVPSPLSATRTSVIFFGSGFGAIHPRNIAP
jgi:hypothetical protein